MNAAARACLAAAKDAAAPLRLPIHAGDGGVIAWFRTMTVLDLDDGALIKAMTAWRLASQAAFLVQFPATPPRTRHWLAETVLPDPDRILFLVTDGARQIFGHYGIILRDGCVVELDNALRSPGVEAPRRLFQWAARGLVAWSFEHLGATAMTAQILTSNFRSLSTTQAAGLSVVTTRPLRETSAGDEIRRVAVDHDAQANVDVRLALLRLDRGRG